MKLSDSQRLTASCAAYSCATNHADGQLQASLFHPNAVDDARVTCAEGLVIARCFALDGQQPFRVLDQVSHAVDQ
ncbi:hypothetical protein [Steroidobacter denitrificans]|uniref:hypothetical protein n=1 Tax=Steroidobacter denitrificans TaxID=465721 RepID=UPI0008302F72|nr:hypothetical protein [Steroidobacter denitrificans]